eukprot:534882-Rhodomonas_salina.3
MMRTRREVERDGRCGGRHALTLRARAAGSPTLAPLRPTQARRTSGGQSWSGSEETPRRGSRGAGLGCGVVGIEGPLCRGAWSERSPRVRALFAASAQAWLVMSLL